MTIARSESAATPAFSDVLNSRRSIRAFTSEPVPEQLIREMLNESARAPSNCNTQPWEAHVIRGRPMTRLSERLMAEFWRGDERPDFSFNANEYTGRSGEHRVEQGRLTYAAQGIPRGDAMARRRAVSRNLDFFGAPQAVFLFMPAIGDSVRVASDVGMFAQNFLLTLVAHGLGGIPQTMLSLWPDAVREELDVAASSKLLLGISFGFVDESHPANTVRLPRDSDTFIRFHGDDS